jgi:hypothetical protein
MDKFKITFFPEDKIIEVDRLCFLLLFPQGFILIPAAVATGSVADVK